jgi:hypothetical protein
MTIFAVHESLVGTEQTTSDVRSSVAGRVGDQPVNASIAGYYSAIRPNGAPAWQLRASVALLFPVK